MAGIVQRSAQHRQSSGNPPWFWLCLAHVLLPGTAWAVIDVQPKVLVVHEEPMTMEISNLGERAEYVSISLSRLLNPGVELEVENLEAITQSQNPPLYASPFKVSLRPGQSKTVTLRPLHKVEREQVYRLDIRPVVNPLDSLPQQASGNVVVNLAYSTLVRQLPAREHSALSVHCEGAGARLTASGNVRYQVREARVDGSQLDPFNVYPGVPKWLAGKDIRIPGQPACSP